MAFMGLVIGTVFLVLGIIFAVPVVALILS